MPVVMEVSGRSGSSSRSSSRLQMGREHRHAEWREEVGRIERLLEAVDEGISGQITKSVAKGRETVVMMVEAVVSAVATVMMVALAARSGRRRVQINGRVGMMRRSWRTDGRRAGRVFAFVVGVIFGFVAGHARRLMTA